LLAKRKSLRFYARGGPDRMSESGPYKAFAYRVCFRTRIRRATLRL
jgi:hypothetical protein